MKYIWLRTLTFSTTYSHAEKAGSSSTTGLSVGGLILHLFADLHVDLEEFADATIQANAFTFVELGLAVLWGNAFRSTRLLQSGRQFWDCHAWGYREEFVLTD